jgi:hypothetical protein
MNREDSQNWVSVAEFTNHPEAELNRQLLKNHGIDVSIWSDDCGEMAGGQTFIQRVRILVQETDRKAALDLLGKGPTDA